MIFKKWSPISIIMLNFWGHHINVHCKIRIYQYEQTKYAEQNKQKRQLTDYGTNLNNDFKVSIKIMKTETVEDYFIQTSYILSINFAILLQKNTYLFTI